VLQAFKWNLATGFDTLERTTSDWKVTTLEVNLKALETIVSDKAKTRVDKLTLTFLKKLQATKEQRQKKRKQANTSSNLRIKIGRKKLREKNSRSPWKLNLWRQIAQKKEVEKGEKGHGNEKKRNKFHLLVKAHQIFLNVPWKLAQNT
jgi:acetyl/propionyl-CoA carboxylase alpha subunit